MSAQIFGVCATLFLIYLYVGHRRAMESFADAGRDLLTARLARYEGEVLAESDFDSGTHRMRLNGQLVFVEFGSSPENPSDFVERRSEECSAGDGTHSSDSNPGEGFVACLTGEGDPISRFDEFTDTSRLGDLGELEFVYVQGDEHSNFISLKPGDDFDAEAMFPQDGGEVPGSDPVDLPRPEQSTRTMHLVSEVDPYALTIYRSELGSVQEGMARYRETVDASIWNIDETNVENLLIVQRKDNPLRMTYIQFTEPEEGDYTMVAFAEAR